MGALRVFIVVFVRRLCVEIIGGIGSILSDVGVFFFNETASTEIYTE